IGVLLKGKGGSPELPRELAMHIAFARPTDTSRSQVPADLVAAEGAILGNSDEGRSKPENVREEVRGGMVNQRLDARAVVRGGAGVDRRHRTDRQAGARAGGPRARRLRVVLARLDDGREAARRRGA